MHGKKIAIAIDNQLFQNLPELILVSESLSEITWFVYGMAYDSENNEYNLQKIKTVHTLFGPTVCQISKIEAGSKEDFMLELQLLLDAKLENLHPCDVVVSLNEIIQD